MKNRFVMMLIVIAFTVTSLVGCGEINNPVEGNIQSENELAVSDTTEDITEEKPQEDTVKEESPKDALVEKPKEDDSKAFTSYDDLIKSLKKGDGYAYVELKGYNGKVLLVTDYVYNNQDNKGTMASTHADVYCETKDGVMYIDTVDSKGTAYPIACEDGLLYIENHHTYISSYVSVDDCSIVFNDYIEEKSADDGSCTYTGYVHEGENKIEVNNENGEELFQKLAGEYFEKKVVNFTVVE